jgi:hypothetical protein
MPSLWFDDPPSVAAKFSMEHEGLEAMPCGEEDSLPASRRPEFAA